MCVMIKAHANLRLFFFNLNREFYNELAVQENSLEGICRTFIHHGAGFKCYIPFLTNFERGLHTLTSYGGSFFTDKQQEIGDELSLVERYGHPKQRLVDYDRYLKEIFMCSQKEYLHGVSMVKVSGHWCMYTCSVCTCMYCTWYRALKLVLVPVYMVYAVGVSDSSILFVPSLWRACQFHLWFIGVYVHVGFISCAPAKYAPAQY